MLAAFTVLIMLIVGFFYVREGLFRAFLMVCNVLAAGLVAFNYWEPLADFLDSQSGMNLGGYTDALCLVVLFGMTLGLLRLVTHNLVLTEIRFHPAGQSIGGACFGLGTGYLVSGFLVCVLQTLPWHRNFMGFEPALEPTQGCRQLLPPDLVWLSLMHRAGAYAFSNQVEAPEDLVDPDSFTDRQVEKYITFDKYGTFEMRYARYRRYDNSGKKERYQHKLDRELHRAPNGGVSKG